MEVFSSILEATFPALNALSILVVFLVSMALVGMQVRRLAVVSQILTCEAGLHTNPSWLFHAGIWGREYKACSR